MMIHAERKSDSLAGGFQGGAKALLKMAKIYNVKLAESRAEELKTLFREANPGICANWKDFCKTQLLNVCVSQSGIEKNLEKGSGFNADVGCWFLGYQVDYVLHTGIRN